MKRLILIAAMSAAFNTQAETLKGAMVASLDEVTAMAQATNANGFGINATSLAHLQEIISFAQVHNLTPIIEMSALIVDASGFFDNSKNSDIKAILAGSDAVVMYDEPLWRTQMFCNAGSQPHCDDAANGYAGTRQLFDDFNQQVGVRSLHVEAWATVGAGAQMMQTAHYLAVDCYDGFHKCGGASMMEYNFLVYNQLVAMEQSNPIGRKMAIIPGAFTGLDISQFESIEYLAQYKQAYDPVAAFVGLVGFFSWGDVLTEQILGAKHYPILQKIMKEF